MNAPAPSGSSSPLRIGGLTLLGAGVVAGVIGLATLATGGGDEDDGRIAAPAPSASSTPSAGPSAGARPTTGAVPPGGAIPPGGAFPPGATAPGGVPPGGAGSPGDVPPGGAVPPDGSAPRADGSAPVPPLGTGSPDGIAGPPAPGSGGDRSADRSGGSAGSGSSGSGSGSGSAGSGSSGSGSGSGSAGSSSGSGGAAGAGGSGDRQGTRAVVRAPVRVYNNSKISGLAARAAEDFRKAGWTVEEVGNYSSGIIPTSTVYYRPGTIEQQAAATMAEEFGLRAAERFAGLDDASPGLIVIVTNDYQRR